MKETKIQPVLTSKLDRLLAEVRDELQKIAIDPDATGEYHQEWWHAGHPNPQINRFVDEQVKKALDFYLAEGFLSFRIESQYGLNVDSPEVSADNPIFTFHEPSNGEVIGQCTAREMLESCEEDELLALRNVIEEVMLKKGEPSVP